MTRSIAPRFSSVWRLGGFTSKLTASSAWRPCTIIAGTAMSRSPGFADEPMTTCEIGLPATSRTGTTLPGEVGCAISGSRVDRSIASVTS